MTLRLALALTFAGVAAQPMIASAQTAAAQAAAPDPARIAAARALLAQLMPADRRDAMIDQMVRPMMDNLRAGMMDSPMFKEARSDPKLMKAVNDFTSGEFDRALALTKQSMPAMVEAMTRAYARRLTLEQLNAITAFYASPAGRAFADQAPNIMSDPDVLAQQRGMMTKAMEGVQDRAMAFATKLATQQEQK